MVHHSPKIEKNLNSLRSGCVEKCPGCSHRNLSEAESLSQKQSWLNRALGSSCSIQIEPIRALSGEARWGYREKTTLHAVWGFSSWDFGLLLNDELIPIPDCPVHSLRINQALEYLKASLPPPDGFPLRFVSISGELLTLVLKTASLSPELLQELKKLEVPGIDGIYLNLNPSAGRRVFASKGFIHLSGKTDSFSHGPSSFQQLIPELFNDALKEARAFLIDDPTKAIIDLYSGTGASIHEWKASGANVIGVELSGEAVKNANQSLGEQIVLQGRASERIPQLSQWAKNYTELAVFANPPRLGLEPEVLEWLSLEKKFRRFAYLSCSTGTLSRDLLILAQGGYTVRRVIPYDFFPQTHHIETLVFLDRA